MRDPMEEEILDQPMEPVEAPAAPEAVEEVPKAIGEKEVQHAIEILTKYKQGKATYDQKIIEDEKWYQLRHWQEIGKKSESKNKNASDQVNPKSAWLFNALMNKVADAMDQYPTAVIKGREQGDETEAQLLTSIIPCIMEQNGMEATYDAVQDSKYKYGVGVYGVFWDQDKLHGLGDIDIARCDVLNLFWEPGLDDIQKSPHFFSLSLEDVEQLVERYPELKGKTSRGLMPEQYSASSSGQQRDLIEKAVVVDWYYKKWQGGHMVLHYCKFCGNTVLYASENDTEPVIDEATGQQIREPRSITGWYQHGLYPFVFDRLYRMEGSPCGVSVIDIGKSPQMFIDLLNKAIKENALVNAKPRYLTRDDGQINEEEFLDTTNPLVHYTGDLKINETLIPIQGPSLPGVVMNVLEQTITELKETSGNRDVSTGGSTGGVTAASGIAAMQEASAKLSRYGSKVSYRAYGEVVNLVLELIREDYDLPRAFRIVGENAADEYIMYANDRIKMQETEGVDGQIGYRLPLFDLTINPMRRSPYNRAAQNEFALQLYQAGFFNPQMADQALLALDLMDFDEKDTVVQKVSQNQTLLMQLQQLQGVAFELANKLDPTGSTSANLAMMMGVEAPPPPAATGRVNTEEEGGESAVTADARQRVAESTQPR